MTKQPGKILKMLEKTGTNKERSGRDIRKLKEKQW